MIEYYKIPSALAITVSLFLLIYIHSNNKKTSYTYILLVFSFMAMNIIESISYYKPFFNLTWFKLYYVFSLTSLMLITNVIFDMAEIKSKVIKAVNPLSLILIVLILSGDYIILDYEPMGRTYQRIAGVYYSLFDVFVVFFITISLVIIVTNILSHKKKSIVRARSEIILLSMLPMLILSLLVIYLMAFGFEINITFYFPLTTIIFVLGSFYAYNSNPIDLTRFLPFTRSSEKYTFVWDFHRARVPKSTLFSTVEKIEKEALLDEIKHLGANRSLTELSKAFDCTIGKIDYKLKNTELKST